MQNTLSRYWRAVGNLHTAAWLAELGRAALVSAISGVTQLARAHWDLIQLFAIFLAAFIMLVWSRCSSAKTKPQSEESQRHVHVMITQFKQLSLVQKYMLCVLVKRIQSPRAHLEHLAQQAGFADPKTEIDNLLARGIIVPMETDGVRMAGADTTETIAALLKDTKLCEC